MKTKKNKKMRFLSTTSQLLTIMSLAGLVGSPVLNGTSALATTLSSDVEISKGVESSLIDDSEGKIAREKNKVIEPGEEKIENPDEPKPAEYIPEAGKTDSETKSTEGVSIVSMTILGEVEAEWDSNTATLTLLSGTITVPSEWGTIPREQVRHIVFKDSVAVDGDKSLGALFMGMEELETIDNLSYLNTSDVTDMSQMFRNTPSLTSADLSSFDTRAVTTMLGMFQQSGFEELDLSSFVTDNVINMSSMFQASNLHHIDVSSFNTSKVTTMRDMFGYSHDLIDIKGLDEFDTQTVISMEGMFWFANSLKSLDLSHFNTKNVTNMAYMFASAHSLTDLNIESFRTDKVQDMRRMFLGTWGLDYLDLSHFDTSAVTDMNHMFAGSRIVNLDIDRENFDTSSVTDMSLMFAHTRNLERIDLSGFDTRAVTNMEAMFWMADTLTELDLSSFETPALTRMNEMFDEARALRKIDMSSFDMRNVQTHNRTNIFQGLESLVELHLGANTNISASALPSETTTPGFLNFWRRVPFQTAVEVKNSSLFIGDNWKPQDNLIKATDRFGEEVVFNRITVMGSVDTDKAGVYKVTYAYDGAEATAEITVKTREENNGTSNGGESSDGDSEVNNEGEEYTQKSNGNLPKTGEGSGLWGVLGFVQLIVAIVVWLQRRKVNETTVK
ncbi:BspA family leucine-rich repeat surface protein [Lactococcus formosensis]|uniref:BspA family leucine-rich repeat surface protein n=1 Tax=Lactococcus formosensis TaxID=1281486 RepID=UPI0022E33A12|nr:BspA family leucine-rich repeat surface protein [Lactococcus formosensis]